MNGLLGALELIAYPATIVWFLVAVSRNGRTLKAAVIAVAVLALTLAQPWGATITPISAQQLRADGGTQVSARGTHLLKVGPVPVALFSFFSRGVFTMVDSGPTSRTYVRTWFGPMTNGTGLPAARDETLDGVTLWRTPGGGYDLREERYGVGAREERDMQSVGTAGNYRPDYQSFRLGFGIVSASGVIYWMFAVPAVAAGVLRLRELRRTRPEEPAAAPA